MDDQLNANHSDLDFLKKRVAELEARDARLQADYEHLKQFYEQAPLAYQSLDYDGCFIEVNQAWLETLGYTREEVIGRNFGDFLHPDWQDHFKKNFPMFRAIGEILGVEIEMVKKDGSPLLVSFDGKINKDSEGNFKHTHCIFQDITERKQAKKVLAHSLSLVQATLEATADGLLVIDHDGKIVGYNNRFAEMWRIPSRILDTKNDELTLNFVLDQLKNPDEFFDLVKVLYDQSEAESFDVLEFKDGRIFERYTRPQLVGGVAVGRVWSFRDITERKRIAATLLESERRFRDMLSNVKQVAIMLDRHGNITFCNDFFLELTGWQQAEVLGQNWFKQFLSKEAFEQVGEIFAAALQTGTFPAHYENEIVTRQGEQRLIIWSNTVLRDEQGQIIGTASLGNDITERKRAERVNMARLRLLQFAATHTLNELLQATLDEAEALSGSLIGFYHFLEADQKTLSIQNWSTRTKAEFCTAKGKGKHYDVSVAGVWVDCIHQRRTIIHNDYASLPHRKGLPPGHAPVVRELVVPVFRGENIVAILGMGNKPRDYIAQDVEAVSLLADLAWDITDRKRAEEQLLAMNNDLERKVEQRTRELQETQKQYLHAEKLSAIGKLSASIAHEFNNPLQGVLSILKGLKKRAILEEEDRELLDAAINESTRMKDLIRSLQDFNRPSSGRQVLMDIRTSLDSMLLLHKSEFKGRRISVVLDYAAGLPQIMAVPDQIKQVFLNLLTNAADACHRTGGVITVSTWQENDRVAVAITDTGVGIKPEDMERIFQPFFTTKPEVKGTGLGLAVSYGIVKKHQGEIRVESQPGKGATFTVLLPIKGGDTATSATDK